MSIYFWISVLGEIIILPLYFWSLEHVKLETKFGVKNGTKIGNILGLISGWGFFLFLFGMWLSPQPRFTVPIFPELFLLVPLIDFSIPLIHLIIFIPIIGVVLWFALNGVKEVTLKVSETHRAEKVITTGVYSQIRHPQYLGAFLAHFAISILFSAQYSMILTLFVIGYLYLIAWKEEKELVKEFGKEYEDYKSLVPMFFPRLKFS
ncbi:MAG: methyltransferase family protein [Candidatus Hodarchaeales archaeon]|jgi:protein-S-isoprenylcysteine O-methyltransferase Ste14